MEPDRVALYRKMLTCRRVEEAIGALWHEGRISGEMHLGLGEEGINAGVIDHLGEGDALSLDHRGTAGLILHGADMGAVIAECLGSAAGLCRGNGGHMHLYSRDHLAAASGIVGASGPAACGFALAAQHLRPGRIAVAFFGEAAMNQGMLMEAMNLAAVWDLPVLFVCRDNGVAITTRSAAVTGGDLAERALGLGVPAKQVNGADVEAVWRAAGEMIDRARGGRGPGFLRATCVRPEGHFLGDALVRIVRNPVTELRPKLAPLVSATISPRGAAAGQRARSLTGIASMLGRTARTQLGTAADPVARLRKRLPIPSAELAQLEREIGHSVEQAVEWASNSLLVGGEAVVP